MEKDKFKKFLPSDCMDIVRSLFMVRGDELKKLFKEEVSIKKAFAIEVQDASEVKHDEIHAHLLARDSGKMWLMKINLFDKSCEVRPLKEIGGDTLNEESQGTSKKEKDVRKYTNRKGYIAKA